MASQLPSSPPATTVIQAVANPLSSKEVTRVTVASAPDAGAGRQEFGLHNITGLNSPPPRANQNQDWNSQLFECCRDEESSWWGCWCCWIVQARTVETFELGKSIQEAVLFWVAIVSFLFMLVLNIEPLGLLWGLMCVAYFIWRRANYRYQIRAKYEIPGHFTDDLMAHSVCMCCAVCQEAREAKLRLLPRLDFCFADSLTEQEAIHERALGRASNNALSSEPVIPESGNIFSHLRAVSRTSRFIVVLSAVVCFLSFVALIGSGRASSILILVLVFVQPLVILYFVYWRTRRQHALLDFVIKTFAVGFWFTTFQAVIVESIAQGILFLIMMPLLNDGTGTKPPPMGSNEAQGLHVQFQQQMSQAAGSIGVGALGGGVGGSSATGTIGKFVFQLMHGLLSSTTSSSSSSTIDGSSTDYFNSGASVDVFTNAAAAAGDATTDDMGMSEHNRHLMRTHIFTVLFVLLCMAYGVAAGVEETMKHFIVRCCQFPSPLTSPHAVLVYLVAGAVGFATCENIEYVFGQHSSPIPGTSLLVGELLILLMRVCMPIHFICAVLQAVNLSKVIMGEQVMNLFQVSALCVNYIFLQVPVFDFLNACRYCCRPCFFMERLISCCSYWPRSASCTRVTVCGSKLSR